MITDIQLFGKKLNGLFSNNFLNQFFRLIFVSLFIFIFLFSKLEAQNNKKSGWTMTIDVSSEQMLSDCRYFGGDSLNGFNLSDTIAKVKNIYTSYIEVESSMYQKEAAFVKQKYGIDELPYEFSLRQNLFVKSLKANPSCSNVDFEDGDFTGWTGGKGYNALSTNPLTIFNTGIFTLGADSPRKSCSYHTIVTNASGNDFYGNFPVQCPNGGVYSVRLGGDNVNVYNGTDCNNLYTCSYPGPNNPHHAAGEVLEQTFTVSATNTLFTFYYAADLNDGGHSAGEQAYFAIQVYDSSGIPINCFSHRIELVAGVVPPGGFLSTNGNCQYSAASNDYHVYSIPWQADSYNLSAYVGQTLTVKFTAAGCTLGGHFGIGYFDAKCGPAEISISNPAPCSGQTVALTAPPSASGFYSWSGPGIVGANNTQSINVNTSGTYTVTVGTGGCAYTLNILVTFTPGINITATAVPSTICIGQNTTLSALGATNYLWMPGNISGSSITVMPNSSTNYTVTGTTNGCTGSASVVVNVNSMPTVAVVALPSSICVGSSSVLTASGASSYNWSGIGNGNPITVSPLATTNYSVTATDINGCTNTNSITVIVNPLPNLTVNASPVNVSCFGGNNGTSGVTASGGTSPYFYNWSNGSNTTNITGLSVGTYNVTVTDINSCSSTATTVITQPTVLVSSIGSSVNVSCFGGSNGSASVAATGGTAPHSYNWSNGANTANTNGLSAGNYLVTVSDNLGCTSTASVIISQPTLLASSITASNPVSCFGGNNGNASVTAVGGTTPYSYNWSNGANTAFVNGLSSGNYFVTVTDNLGCTSTASVVISQPVLLTLSITASNNVSCFGGNNGNASVTAFGGTAPYNYNWSNGANTAFVNGLSSGNYFVTVADNIGCTSTASVVITQPIMLTSSMSASTNVSCFGGNTGAASVVANGGTLPYNYSWSNGQNTAVANGLSAGNYTATITDNLGCTSIASVVITQPILLTSSISASTIISCFGGNNGTASVVANGGTLPYNYSWSNGQNTAVANGLTAGTYFVTITDNLGCTSIASVVITQPILLTSSVSAYTNVSCFGGNNGTASVVANGGTVPYSYNWSNGQNTAVANGLNAGNYTATITDGLGCTSTTLIIITQPALLTSNISASTNVSCFGGNNGAANVIANGGTSPYIYNWSNGANTSGINGLSVGSYSVTVTDSHGCTAISTRSITQPTQLNSSIPSSHNVNCHGGNNGWAIIAGSGGTAPYTYNWSNGANTSAVNGLIAGNYSVTVTDNLGCTSASALIITQPSPLNTSVPASHDVSCYGGNNGWAEAVAVGGTGPYSFHWSNGQNTQAIANLTAGNYTVTGTDVNSCNHLSNVAIGQPTALTLNIGNINNVSCFNGSNGSAAVIVTGGSPPYNYEWSNGSNTSVANNLTAGSYYITVFDANGCIRQDTIIINQPGELLLSTSQNDTLCFGTAAYIFAQASGGTPPYVFVWDNGLGNGQHHNVTVSDNNIYHVYAIDANGCISGTREITISHYQNLEVYASANNNKICYGDSTIINVLVNGAMGNGNIYAWNNGLGHSVPPFYISPSITTEYIVTVTGVCENVVDTVKIIVSPLPDAHVNINRHFGCDAFQANFYETSNPPLYHYLWTFGDPLSGVYDTSTLQNPTHFYSGTGTYDVSLTVYNDFGCNRSYYFNDYFIIYPKPIADFGIHPEYISVENGKATFMDYSSSDASHWYWDFGDPNSGPMNHSTNQNTNHIYGDVGIYTVWLIVENENGCTDSIAKNVEIHDYYTFYAANAFTPNGDGDNEKFIPTGINWKEGSFEFYIYDRWGKLIYETNDPQAAWDGRVNNKEIAPQGVYTWLVYVRENVGILRKYVGSVFIIF